MLKFTKKNLFKKFGGIFFFIYDSAHYFETVKKLDFIKTLHCLCGLEIMHQTAVPASDINICLLFCFVIVVLLYLPFCFTNIICQERLQIILQCLFILYSLHTATFRWAFLLILKRRVCFMLNAKRGHCLHWNEWYWWQLVSDRFLCLVTHCMICKFAVL